MKKYLIHTVCLALIAVFIFDFEYLPMQDYPVLLYEGFVLNQYVFHVNTFNGFFYLHPYIPPNAVSTILLGTMDLFLEPLFAGKLYLFLLGAALYSGIFRFLAFHLKQQRIVFAVVAFFLTFNLHFIAGYLNFVTGLALTLHLIIYFREGKHGFNYALFGLSLFCIYLSHFAALVLFGLYFVVYFAANRNYKGILRLSLAAIPTIAIFIHYLLTRITPILSQEEDYRSWFHIINGKFLVFFSPIIPFHDFKWIHDIPFPLVIVNYLFCMLVFAAMVYALLKNIIRHNYTLEFWLASITMILVFFLPLYLGGVLLPGERFVVFCVINIFCLWVSNAYYPKIRGITTVCFFALAVTSYVYVLWNTSSFNAMIEVGQTPKEAIIHPEWKREGTNGFLHFQYYDKIVQKQAFPVFDVGLFGYTDSTRK